AALATEEAADHRARLLAEATSAAGGAAVQGAHPGLEEATEPAAAAAATAAATTTTTAERAGDHRKRLASKTCKSTHCLTPWLSFLPCPVRRAHRHRSTRSVLAAFYARRARNLPSPRFFFHRHLNEAKSPSASVILGIFKLFRHAFKHAAVTEPRRVD